MTRARAWALILATIAAACGAPEAPEAPPRPALPQTPASTNGPLSAGERDGLRGVGRAVLLAQRDTVEDLDVVALGGEMAALRRDLEAATRLAPTPPRPVEAGPVEPTTAELFAPDPLQALRERADAILSRRVLLAVKAEREPGTWHASRAAAVTAAAERIETELREALVLPAAERKARLLALRDRLQPQDPAERRRALGGGTPAVLMSNGNTTLTKHR